MGHKIDGESSIPEVSYAQAYNGETPMRIEMLLKWHICPSPETKSSISLLNSSESMHFLEWFFSLWIIFRFIWSRTFASFGQRYIYLFPRNPIFKINLSLSSKYFYFKLHWKRQHHFYSGIYISWSGSSRKTKTNG
jgi:hypothetical protein